jgi:hypothetical protein
MKWFSTPTEMSAKGVDFEMGWSQPKQGVAEMGL